MRLQVERCRISRTPSVASRSVRIFSRSWHPAKSRSRTASGAVLWFNPTSAIIVSNKIMHGGEAESDDQRGQHKKEEGQARQDRHPGTFPADGQTLMQEEAVNHPDRECPDHFRIGRPKASPDKGGVNGAPDQPQ